MAVAASEQKKLCLRSGGLCAMCKKQLTRTSTGGLVILGEIAHIVAESPDGPRGNHPLSLQERNLYTNLLFLCNVDHQLIDDEPQTYPVERLHGIKEEHERWVEKTLGIFTEERLATPPPAVNEALYSTLLPVKHMPYYVYGVECSAEKEEYVREELGDLRKGEMAPFILRGGKLWAFQALDEQDSPFAPVAQGKQTTRVRVHDWWDDPDKSPWFAALLGRALNKLTGRKGLHLDKEHHRFYFPAAEDGSEVKIPYQPLNQDSSEVHVAWRPITKATGEPKNHWLHRAVALRFQRVSQRSWCLSVRPEMRVTLDGFNSVPSDMVGRRVTKKKSRMFNHDLLAEIQLWRHILSGGKPRIVMSFISPGQYIEIASDLMEGNIAWPGMPDEHKKSFQNVHFQEDLFSFGEINALRTAELDLDEDEEEFEEDLDEEDVDEFA